MFGLSCARARLAMIAAAFLWTACGLLSNLDAQSDGAKTERNGRSRENRMRWDKLSREDREHLKKKFEHFKKMSGKEQAELRKRHEQLEQLRERIVAEHAAELKTLPPDEQKRFVDGKVRVELEKLKDRIRKKQADNGHPGDGRSPGGRSRGGAREMREKLAEKNGKLARQTLKQLRDEGRIDEREYRRIDAMPREDKIDAVLKLHKRAFLSALEGVVPPEDMQRFQGMPARRFHREMWQKRRERGMHGSFANLVGLTPEQEKELGGIRDDHERTRCKMLFFEQNLRRRLTEMGVPSESIENILKQPHHRRIELLKEVLQKLPPERIPPGLRGMRKPRDKEQNGDRKRRGGKEPRGPGKDRRGPDKGPRNPDRERNGPDKERRFFHAPPDRD